MATREEKIKAITSMLGVIDILPEMPQDIYTKKKEILCNIENITDEPTLDKFLGEVIVYANNLLGQYNHLAIKIQKKGNELKEGVDKHNDTKDIQSLLEDI